MQPVKKTISRFTAAPTKKGAPLSPKAVAKKATRVNHAAPRTLITEKERHNLIAQAAYLAVVVQRFSLLPRTPVSSFARNDLHSHPWVPSLDIIRGCRC
jgi:hypothetical protein